VKPRILYKDHPGGSRDPEGCSASAGRGTVWTPASAGVVLLFVFLSSALCCLSSGNAHDAVEDEVKPLNPELCDALVKHTPAPDVNYQPGVDVDGNPVAPADLPGQPQIKMPEKFDIPITVSLSKALNLSTSGYPGSVLGEGTETTLGTFTVDGDKVSFNGQPLTDQQQDNLAVLCMRPNE